MAWPVPDSGGSPGYRFSLPLVVGLGVVSGVVYLGNFKLAQTLPFIPHPGKIGNYLILFLPLSLLYLCSVLLVLKKPAAGVSSRVLLGVIILFAVLFRISLVPHSPTVLSDDMYRYIWDGRVQQSGINPYRYAPAAPELEGLRDQAIYPNINRKQAVTIYPAAAQGFFRLFHLLAGDSVAGFKGLLVLFDIMTVLALAGLLRTYGHSPAKVIIYAWNPLVVFEIAYSGHLEGLAVFFLTTAFYLHALGKKNGGVVLLAVAGAVKLYPAVLLAAMLNRGHRIKGLLLFGIGLVLLYLPYVGVGSGVFGFLPTYLSNPSESFNLGLKSLLLALMPGLGYARLSRIFIFCLLVAAAVVLVREKKRLDVLRSAYWLTGLLLVFMPASLHPWYVIMIVPFLAFFPSPAWLLFSIAVSLSYLKYADPHGIMPAWVPLAEYLPLFTLLAASFFLKIRAPGSGIPFPVPNRPDEELMEMKK